MKESGPSRIVVERRTSTLRTTKGVLPLRLVQQVVGIESSGQPAPADLVGRRAGIFEVLEMREPSDAEAERARRHVQAVPKRGISVVAFERGLVACEHQLKSLRSDQALVGGLNTVRPGSRGRPSNVTLVAAQQRIYELKKCSLSSDDDRRGVVRGERFTVFLPESGDRQSVRWAVLNCHEYTHPDLVNVLLRYEIELVVVLTTHAAARLYWEYAISDVHRLFSYVVIANIAEVGGSGVFAPFRRVGKERSAQLGSAGQVFGARGPARFEVDIDLEIGELRNLRKEFGRRGFAASERRNPRRPTGARALVIDPVVPSQHFLDTVDRKPGAPRVRAVRDVPHGFSASTIRVAVGQLHSLPISAYIDTQYRIRNAPSAQRFTDKLTRHLDELRARCDSLGPAPSGLLLDLLVLPEVFTPRTYLSELQALSDELGCAIVTGVGYPGSKESDNANECVILRHKAEPVTYRKITRSQYDAHRDIHRDRMPMTRGETLVRFVDSAGHGFGVLICYDFSHFDLVHRLNYLRRREPLELLVVVAHNPFGELYQSCCIADSHRFYQYVTMCNVAAYGGSGVYGPLRVPGARQTLMHVGKGVEAFGVTELDLAGLRAARESSDAILDDTSDANALRGFMRRPGSFQARVSRLPAYARR